MCAFFIRTSFLQLFSSFMYTENRRSYVKFACLTLMKLTAGVNFINILRAHFSYESALRSFGIFDAKILYKKRSRKTLIKLTADLVSEEISISFRFVKYSTSVYLIVDFLYLIHRAFRTKNVVFRHKYPHYIK